MSTGLSKIMVAWVRKVSAYLRLLFFEIVRHAEVCDLAAAAGIQQHVLRREIAESQGTVFASLAMSGKQELVL